MSRFPNAESGQSTVTDGSVVINLCYGIAKISLSPWNDDRVGG